MHKLLILVSTLHLYCLPTVLAAARGKTQYKYKEPGFYQHLDYYASPRYSYQYGVNDPHTHDMKSAYEARDGDVTHGRYSVMQPDGILRVVTYTSSPGLGFQADVKMLNGYAQHPPQHYAYRPTPVLQPTKSPVVKKSRLRHYGSQESQGQGQDY